MTPAEVNRMIDSKRPSHVNGIPNDDFDRMIEKREEMEFQGIKVL
tara:strand:- start:239 stop:373 length:135 start_codon:yes stop_codon:yes gene_type:complete